MDSPTTTSSAVSAVPPPPERVAPAAADAGAWPADDLDAASATPALEDPAALARRLADEVCRRFALDLFDFAKRTAPVGHWYDARAARHVVAFFRRYLRHTRGKWAGQVFEPDVWQEALLRVLFGWKRPDGTRRFRVLYLEIARKNGKTTLAAGIGLYLLYADGEAGAEIYCAATDTDQALIVFNEARRMRAQAGPLAADTYAFKKTITVPRTFSKMQVLSADSGSKDGLNASGIIGDEFHAWKDRALYDVLHTATGARAQPLELYPTTAGAEKRGPCWEMHEYAQGVLAGAIADPEFLPALFGAGPDDPIDELATIAKANPSLGKTVAVEYLLKEAKRARDLPRYENTFRRYHLGQWTEQVTRWLPIEKWDACPAEPLTLEQLAGREAFCGLDLSAVSDLTALAGVFPRTVWAAGAPEIAFDLWLRFWMPAEGLAERSRRDKVPYDQWVEQGWITATEGNVVDYDKIRAEITGMHGAAKIEGVVPLMERVNLRELAIDRWNATQITTQLAGDGVTVVPFGQGFGSMSAPSKHFEALVLAGKVNHMGNPVLRWMVQNVSVKTDPADNVKPVKPDRRMSAVRIDGIVALLMGLGRAIVNGQGASMYETVSLGVA